MSARMCILLCLAPTDTLFIQSRRCKRTYACCSANPMTVLSPFRSGTDLSTAAGLNLETSEYSLMIAGII